VPRPRGCITAAYGVPTVSCDQRVTGIAENDGMARRRKDAPAITGETEVGPANNLTMARVGASLLALMGLPTMVGAQEPPPSAAPDTAGPERAADPNALADIIVTATRTEQSLQKVPIAVTAYGSAAITALGAKTVGDLADVTPNLARTSGPTGGNDAFFFIRGIGQVDSNPANDPGVGVYIDGVYLSRLQGASLDAQDIARVEVLRGPQGTLFGRNTIGGAINITSRDPGEAFAGEARLTGGSRSRIDAYAGFDLPLGDKFAVRLSGSTRNQDGWGKNVYTGKTFGDVHNINGRVKAIWRPDEALKVTLAADILRARGTAAQTILTGVNTAVGVQVPGFPVGTTPLGVPFPVDLLADTSSDVDKSFASVNPRSTLDNWGTSATIDWHGGGSVDAKAIFAYRRVKQFAANDFDGTAYRLYDNFFDTHSNQYSGELQLIGTSFDDRLSWIAGVFGSKEDIYNNNAICLGTNLGAPIGPGGPTRNAGGCLQNNQVFNLKIESVAGFVNATYRFTDRFSLVAGGRYTHEHKKQSFDFFLDNRSGVFSFFGFPPIAYIPTLSPNNPAVGIPTTYAKSWSQFTPKLGLNYQASPDLLLYASYSRGFKSGGFNGRPNPGASGGFNAILPYDPETLDAFEIGVKADLADHRVRLNAAAFYSIYDGIQLLVLDPASGFFNNANAGRNRITGFEVELTAKPVNAVLLYANVGYTHTDYRKLDPRAGIPPDSRLPVTPRWTVGLGASYTAELGFGSLTPRIDYSYRSAVFYGAGNAPLEFQSGFGLLNLRLTLTDTSERYSLSGFATNVADKRYISNAQDVRSALGVAFAQIGAPREFGVEVGVKF